MEAVATAVAAPRGAPVVDVTCGGCGCTFELSKRREYAHRVAGKEPRCAMCRRAARPMTPAERDEYRRWWLEESGLSRRELTEIAVGLGGWRRSRSSD